MGAGCGHGEWVCMDGWRASLGRDAVVGVNECVCTYIIVCMHANAPRRAASTRQSRVEAMQSAAEVRTASEKGHSRRGSSSCFGWLGGGVRVFVIYIYIFITTSYGFGYAACACIYGSDHHPTNHLPQTNQPTNSPLSRIKIPRGGPRHAPRIASPARGRSGPGVGGQGMAHGDGGGGWSVFSRYI